MELTIIPRMSEQTVGQAMNGTYIFNVPITATKQQISQAISRQYGVKVVSVNTATTDGKVKRSYRKGKTVTGKRVDVKKAFVRLAEGDKIAVFEQAAQTEESK